ncbi:hypothetical protein AGMMS50229_19780 [Campylobacterota bacterium]|nr:hypothetical protein AGMMS50229_19780 [Campylobacterota bacterium]
MYRKELAVGNTNLQNYKLLVIDRNDKEDFLDYRLNKTLAEIHPYYTFDVSCEGTVPVALLAFLESKNFVHSIQLAISVGGDSDSIAAVTGSVAEAFYRDIPKELIDFVTRGGGWGKLTDEMRKVITDFREKYHNI